MNMSVIISHTDWGSDLLVQLQPLWKEAVLCDTTIECSQKNIIQAHSILLAAASPKLSSYFRMAEQGSYTIVTPDIPVYVWRNVLTFIYQGRLEIREDELVATYNFAQNIEMYKFSKKLGDELKKCKLTLEDQENFRVCASPQNQRTSPRSHVTSPQSQMTSPRNQVASLNHPIGSPITQMSSVQGHMTSQSQMTSQMVTQGHLASQGQMVSTSANVQRSSPRIDAKADGGIVAEPERQSSRESTHSVPRTEQETRPTQQNVAAPETVIPTERYECKACLQNFNRKSALDKHVTECPQLKPKASPVMSYKNFYTRIGDGSKGGDSCKFKCDLCGKEYPAYQGLYTHLKGKHADQVQVASANNRHFRPGQLMNKPTKSQLLNKNASCPICKKQFQSYSAMLTHKTSHRLVTTRRSSASAGASESPAKNGDGGDNAGSDNFRCNICGRSFNRKMHLGSHMRCHEKV